jgi:polyhydroxyalkanoate synthesis regulator phasin
MAKSTLKSYIEAGTQFTEMPRQQAEAFVKGLVKSGDIRRRDAEELLQTLLARGRETSDRVAGLVQAEVAKQVQALSERFDDIEGRLEALTASFRISVAGGARSTPAGADVTATGGAADHEPAPAGSTTETTGDATPTKASAPKKSSAKKSGAKKSAAKKSSAKKSGAKKSSAKKSTAKSTKAAAASDAVGSSGVRKVSTTRPTSAPE